jgi:hypothetical protein
MVIELRQPVAINRGEIAGGMASLLFPEVDGTAKAGVYPPLH